MGWLSFCQGVANTLFNNTLWPNPSKTFENNYFFKSGLQNCNQYTKEKCLGHSDAADRIFENHIFKHFITLSRNWSWSDWQVLSLFMTSPITPPSLPPWLLTDTELLAWDPFFLVVCLLPVILSPPQTHVMYAIVSLSSQSSRAVLCHHSHVLDFFCSLLPLFLETQFNSNYSSIIQSHNFSYTLV